MHVISRRDTLHKANGTKSVVLFIAVVKVAENSIQSILFPKTYDPSVMHKHRNNSNTTNHNIKIVKLCVIGEHILYAVSNFSSQGQRSRSNVTKI